MEKKDGEGRAGCPACLSVCHLVSHVLYYSVFLFLMPSAGISKATALTTGVFLAGKLHQQTGLLLAR